MHVRTVVVGVGVVLVLATVFSINASRTRPAPGPLSVSGEAYVRGDWRPRDPDLDNVVRMHPQFYDILGPEIVPHSSIIRCDPAFSHVYLEGYSGDIVPLNGSATGEFSRPDQVMTFRRLRDAAPGGLHRLIEIGLERC